MCSKTLQLVVFILPLIIETWATPATRTSASPLVCLVATSAALGTAIQHAMSGTAGWRTELQIATLNISVLKNEHPPLAAEISSHLSSHGARVQDNRQDARLPLPTPQDIETIRRIAEVLVMFGQQVIPAIIGPSSGGSTTTVATVSEIPNDAVNAI